MADHQSQKGSNNASEPAFQMNFHPAPHTTSYPTSNLSSSPALHTSRPPSFSSRLPSDPIHARLPDRHPIMRKSSQGQLMPPLPTRNFAISPPPSPPVGWISTFEEGPNMLPHPDDLSLRLQALVVDGSGQYCVYAPEFEHYYGDDDTSDPIEIDSHDQSNRSTPDLQERVDRPLVRNGFVLPPIFVVSDHSEDSNAMNDDNGILSTSIQIEHDFHTVEPLSKMRTPLPPPLVL